MPEQTLAGDWLRSAAVALHSAEVPRAMAEARALLASATGETASFLFAHPERVLTPSEHSLADAILNQRINGAPIGRILGVKEFWSLPFLLSDDTLEPRPDTETIVQAALDHAPSTQPTVLDLGTGTGCILLAVLHDLPGATGIGTDRSRGALKTARANAAALSLDGRAMFMAGDWGAALMPESMNLILSNPPYVATKHGPTPDFATAKHDPELALYAGADGLNAYRAILPDLPRLLAPGGVAVLEIGINQMPEVRALGEQAGLEWVEARSDLADIPRALIFRGLGHK
jgi:release factor glutamine methyltransferase